MTEDEIAFCVGWFYPMDPPVHSVSVIVGLHAETDELITSEQGDLMEERMFGHGGGNGRA